MAGIRKRLSTAAKQMTTVRRFSIPLLLYTLKTLLTLKIHGHGVLTMQTLLSLTVHSEMNSQVRRKQLLIHSGMFLLPLRTYSQLSSQAMLLNSSIHLTSKVVTATATISFPYSVHSVLTLSSLSSVISSIHLKPRMQQVRRLLIL